MSSWYAIEGERICRIQTVENRQHIDGTIRLTLPRFDHVVGGGGGFSSTSRVLKQEQA